MNKSYRMLPKFNFFRRVLYMKKTYLVAIIAFVLLLMYMTPAMSSYTSEVPPASSCSCNKPQRSGVYMPNLKE